MADKRLSPDQLRARLAANLANSPERGAAVDAAREIARDLSREVVDRLPKANDAEDAPAGLTGLKYASSPAATISVPLGKLRATKTPLDPPNTPEIAPDPLLEVEQGDTGPALPTEPAPASSPTAKSANSSLSVAVTPRGTAATARTPIVKSTTERARTTHPTVLHRHHEGAVLRGYRIAASLHRRAERAKLEASAKRGALLFWDEMMQLAIDNIPNGAGDLAAIANALPSRSGASVPAGGTRVLQAAIRADQEVKLRMLRLDLEEVSGTTVRLEDMWTWLVERVIDQVGQQ